MQIYTVYVSFFQMDFFYIKLFLWEELDKRKFCVNDNDSNT